MSQGFLGHPFPAEELGLPCGWLTGSCRQVPDPDGVSTFHTHEMRSGWVPSVPRGRRCPHGWRQIPSRRLPHYNDKVPTTLLLLPSPRVGINEASLRVHCIHPSDLPLACGPRMEREPLGFSPSFTPCRHQQRMSGWGQACWALAWVMSPSAGPPIYITTHCVRPRVAIWRTP